MGLDVSHLEVQEALEHSSFDRLQALELQRRFKETPRKAGCFFRSGRANAWKEVLSTAQVEQVVADHGSVMEWAGYGKFASD